MEPNKTSFFQESWQAIQDNIRDRILLIKLEFIDKASRLIAMFITTIVIALIGFFVMLFISMMAGYYFAHITGSLFIGFGIVAIIYAVLLVIIIFFGKRFIQRTVANNIIKIVFEKEEENKQHD
jgi:ABC-type glycerol-3-phosphate transport system permease component